MQIKTQAFASGGSIPSAYTCDGQNSIPPFQFSEVPKEAKSLAFIVHDPDAPRAGGWDHYVAWNISPDTSGVEEGIEPTGVKGKNSSGELVFQGPCPHVGEHRYYFKLYALDAILDIPEGSAKPELIEAMKGHTVGEAEVFGRYKRP